MTLVHDALNILSTIPYILLRALIVYLYYL